MSETFISGEIAFDEASPPLENATVRVILEDVTRADAAAREVTRTTIVSYSRAPGDPPLAFSLRADNLDPARRYEVRVHVDRASSGRISAGDEITMESHPVATRGYPNHVDVRVRPVV
jgi:uncharacterized lipoprotein YbaY